MNGALAAGGLLTLLAIVFWSRRTAPGAGALAVMMTAAAGWSTVVLLALAAPTVPEKLAWSNAQFLLASVTTMAWLVYLGRAFGHAAPWLFAWAGVGLTIGVTTTTIVGAGDPNLLVWRGNAIEPSGAIVFTHGPFFWVFVASVYLSLLAGAAMLTPMLTRSLPRNRWPAALLLVAQTVPLVASGLYVAQIGPSVNLTPFAIILSGLVVAPSVARRRQLSQLSGLLPSARDAVFEGITDGVIVLDSDDQIVDLNPVTRRLFGDAAVRAVGRSVETLLPGWPLSNDRPTRRLIGANTFEIEVSPLRRAGDPSFGRLVVLRDITERERVEAALRASEHQYRSVVNSVNEVIFQTDRAGRWLLLNPAWTQITGLAVAETLGAHVQSSLHPDDWALYADRFAALIDGKEQACRYEVRCRSRDGMVRWVQVHARPLLNETGGIVGTTGTLTDITERRSLEERLSYQAFHDPLTNLANRKLFRERVAQALSRSADRPVVHAVLFIDVDHFKEVNDTLGHAAGDELLIGVASRVSACIRSADMVARLGGDEFAILLENLSGEQDATLAAKRVLEALAQPFQVHDRDFRVSASIGVAVATEASAERLLRNADIAMYAAKREGRGRAVLFEPGMDQAIEDRLALGSDLRRAIENAELDIVYQPTVTLATGTIYGVEALARWRHPVRGSVAPALFIRIAEETGLIVPLGRWVLREACQQVRRWQLECRWPLSVAINLSAHQLQQPDLVDDVAMALAESGLPAESLTLEITESDVMADAERAIETLVALRGLGVRLAVDDFGTGYSSLSYLQRFPVDILKIDKAFVAGIETHPDDAALVKTIIQLAKILRLQTVAEGIERPEQASLIHDFGCALGQGYLFAHPLPAAEITALLAARQAVPDAA